MYQAPVFNLPEFAFFGRSNVGKSLLMNALVGRKNLVKVSGEPGKTKELNFFKLANHLILVDVPGYGYAKVNRNLQGHWNRVLLDYLTQRLTLKRVYLLIDIKVGLKSADLEVMTTLDQVGVSYALVCTKVDKHPAALVNKNLEAIRALAAKYVAAYPKVFLTSARKNIGILELQRNMVDLL